MNLTNLRAELARVEQRQAVLRRRVERTLATRIRSLPRTVGFPSVDALVDALLPHTSEAYRSRLGGRSARSKLPGSTAPGAVVSGKLQPRPRGRRGYPSALKARVKKLVERGTLTHAQIAKGAGVSTAILTIWKRKWGLGRKRS